MTDAGPRRAPHTRLATLLDEVSIDTPALGFSAPETNCGVPSAPALSLIATDAQAW
jgi:hypothetical protein